MATSFSMKDLWPLSKQAASEWSEDKATKLAAALAFYTMLSIAPLLIICMKIAGKIFGAKAASGQISGYLTNTVGAKGAEAAQEMIKNASQQGSGVIATIISVVVLILSASGVFGELQDSLNTIWEVKPKPNRGIMGIIKDRFFSMTLVLGVVFLLLVSLVASAAIAGMTHAIGIDHGFFWGAVEFVISLVVVTVLFGLIFRYLPDAKVQWSDVWVGAVLTAVLFTVGKWILGWYLGRASTTSVYGAAGSMVALLLWVYYSSQILFFGAEFTQVYAKKHGRGIEPAENALPMTESDRVAEGKPHDSGQADVDTGAGQPGGRRPAGAGLAGSRQAARDRVLVLPPAGRLPEPQGASRTGKQVAIAAASLVAGEVLGG